MPRLPELSPADLPRATLTPPRRGRLSAVWVIPLLAAVLAIGIAVQRVLNEGPTIGIVFKAAAGIEAGKTEIRYKDVKIGLVHAVELIDNYSRVLVTARIDKHAAGLIVKDARFWVVEPRVTLSGVTGLGTLLAGNFIGFEAGRSSESARRFTALEVAPVIAIDAPGTQYTLTADDGGSLGVGSPVYYRRLSVGQVLSSQLAADGDSVRIQVFVKRPYDRYITANTRFWNASGVDVSLNANGFNVQTQSLVSVLIGGIAFDTPDFTDGGALAVADTVFALYVDRTSALRQPEAIARRYVLYFRESLRGLSVGAPVTLLGLNVGEVTAVGFDLDPVTADLRGRVEVVAYPEKAVEQVSDATDQAQDQDMVASEARVRAFLQRLVMEKGLRAQLRSGSLVTGQMYISLDYFPNEARTEVDWAANPPVLPTVASTLPNLEEKVTEILAKIDKIPFADIGAEVKTTVATLNRALREIDQAVGKFNTGLTPELQAAAADLRRVLASADQALKNADTSLLGNDAPVQVQLLDTLSEVTRAARSVRVLSDYLARHPEALLKGKGGR